jgi:hypothetical protein
MRCDINNPERYKYGRVSSVAVVIAAGTEVEILGQDLYRPTHSVPAAWCFFLGRQSLLE